MSDDRESSPARDVLGDETGRVGAFHAEACHHEARRVLRPSPVDAARRSAGVVHPTG